MATAKSNTETPEVRVAPVDEALATTLPTDDAFESRAAEPTSPARTASFSTLPLTTPTLTVIKGFEDADRGESISLLLATPQQGDEQGVEVEEYEYKLEDFSPMA